MADSRQTIFVNARFLTQPLTGVQRYAIEVSRELCRLDSSFKFRFVTPRDIVQHEIAHELDAEIVGRRTGHAWEQLDLPWVSRRAPLLGLGNTGPTLKRHQIVAIYDASTRAKPESYSLQFRLLYRILLPIVGRTASQVITASQFSRNELSKYRTARPDRITVVHGAADHMDRLPIDYSILEKAGLVGKPFVLAVSSANPTKNFDAFIEAMSILDDKPYVGVVAGGQYKSIFAGNPQKASIKRLGYVTDGQLKALYCATSLFVVPSLYEGFGLTPLEAMRCGSPTLVSNAASLPEVCGDASVYFDPRDRNALATEIDRIMSSPDLRDELKLRSQIRATEFQWLASARTINQLLEQHFGCPGGQVHSASHCQKR